MEGIYKHKETGAEQIFSEVTVETLGGSKIWEFVGVFSPNSNEPIESKVASDDKIKDVPVLEVIPNVREIEVQITPLDKLIEQENAPKGKAKVVSLKDVE